MTTNWSTQQTAIFNFFSTGKGNLVVRARAGTGKTTTIIEGIKSAPETSILLAAFNKEIANELTAKVGRDSRVQVKTLHGLGFLYLRRAWQGIDVESDSATGERAWNLALKSAPNAPDNIVKLIANLHTKVRELNPFARNEGDVLDIAYRFDLVPDIEEQEWNDVRVATCVLRALELAKVRTSTIDYADMIFLPLVHRFVRPWFSLVVIDEAQDMSESQLELATQACRRDGRIVVVGDDCQAIYAFRGADSGSLDRLKKELRAIELGLTITYRCPKSHVAMAALLVPDYTAAPSAIDGVIAKVSRDQLFAGVKPGDFVISRTNAPLVEVCLGLLKQGVRATIRGRDIGKGILALVRKLRAKNPTQLLERLTEWRKTELERAAALGEKGESLAQSANDRFELVVALTEGAVTLREIEDRLFSLFSDDKGGAKVICTSVHKVKGLETANTWLLEGTFRENNQEERNIRYVSLTRAKQTMSLVSGFDRKKPA